MIFSLSFSLTGCKSTEKSGDAGGGFSDNPDNIPSGVYREISPSDAKKVIDGGECILLDVRTADEFNLRHIPGALLLPVDELADRAPLELSDKSALIIVYCRSGARSRRAAEMLLAMEYTDVLDLGGINGWPYETQ